jgi:hypothetical protein
MKRRGTSQNSKSTDNPKKKYIPLSQHRLHALISQDQLPGLSFDSTETSKAIFDTTDLRTEKDKNALLLWVYTPFL